MAALKVGDYIIYFYDKYGTKDRGKKITATNFCTAKTKGRRYAKVAGFRSYRIDRCLFNSLDERRDW